MRWKTNNPKHGDRRDINRFCLLPTNVGDTIVWLEKIRVIQEYKTYAQTIEGHRKGRWIDIGRILINK